MADSDSRAGLHYVSPELMGYLANLHAPHDAALEASFRAPEREGLPAIQVGHAEGKLLGLLLRLARAERVVEVGTLAGYSAIWIARALPPAGRLFTVEIDPHHAAVARARLDEAGLSHRVEVRVGEATRVLADLEAAGPFDAVFLDADKGRYDVYGEWAARNVRPGGLILADNSHFFGKLLGDQPEAEAMRRFHAQVARDFDSVSIPTPDGLVVGIRRGP